MITTKLMRQLVPKIGPQAAADWAAALSAALPYANITTRRQVNHLLAQLAHESAGFSDFEEDLSYSRDRLMIVWPSRFKDPDLAAQFARNPKALANRVYNGRMGNRLGSDDGWYFRGRGPKQVTGRDNYTAFQKWLDAKRIDADVMRQPDLLTTPRVGALSAIWFWDANMLNVTLTKHVNETEAVRALTRKINGGEIGLKSRTDWFNRVRVLDA